MTRDFEDIFRLDDLNDDELRALVRDQLADYETVDADNILVTVSGSGCTRTATFTNSGGRTDTMVSLPARTSTG